jgi:hypothetical protein
MNSLRIPAILLILAATVLLARLHTIDEPLERDLMTYAVIGHELLEGRVLYADLWDHKPPAIYLTFALGEVLTGYGQGAVLLVNMVATLTTLLGVYFVGRAVGSSTAGLWAAAFWAVISGDLLLQGNQPNVEVFLNTCLVWVFYCFLRLRSERFEASRIIALGTPAVLASFYKPVAFAIVAALSIGFILREPASARGRAALQIAAVAGMGLASWLLLGGYFLAVGRFTDFLGAVFLYNHYYIGGSVVLNLLRSAHPELLIPIVLKATVPVAVLAVAGCTFSLVRGSTNRGKWFLMIAYLLGTQLAVALPGRSYPHYYQLWLPPLCIAAGWACGEFVQIQRPSLRWLPHLAGASALVLLVGFQLPYYRLDSDDWSRTKYSQLLPLQTYGDIFVSSREVGQEIDALLEPGERFFHVGYEPGLYFASRRSPPVGALWAKHLFHGPVAESLSLETERRLKADLPELVVTTRNAIPEGSASHPVVRLIAAHYEPLAHRPARGPFLLLARRNSELQARVSKAEQ